MSFKGHFLCEVVRSRNSARHFPDQFAIFHGQNCNISQKFDKHVSQPCQKVHFVTTIDLALGGVFQIRA